MADWQYAQQDRADELAQVSYFTMKKRQEGHDIEFLITLKEYVTPPAGQHSKFFAEADKHVNQKTAAILPSGWGDSMLKALADCMRMIRQFPYEE
ncbi:MAG: hypothetical protein ACRD5M_16540 [Candidatus Acidiferrales bacterium]